MLGVNCIANIEHEFVIKVIFWILTHVEVTANKRAAEFETGELLNKNRQG